MIDTANIAKTSGIYTIICQETGKQYVGSAIDLHRRACKHLVELSGKKHHSVKLQRAWDKYGSSSFVFDVLESVADPSQLIQREQEWLDNLDVARVGYNVSPTAGSSLGIKRSATAKQNMSIARKGIPLSEEHKALLKIKMAGRVITSQHRANISAANKGRIMGPEWIAKIVASATGKKRGPRTEAHCHNLSLALTGKKASAETIAKLSATHQGPRHNRRTCFMEYNGEMMALRDVAELTGTQYKTLHKRYKDQLRASI